MYFEFDHSTSFDKTLLNFSIKDKWQGYGAVVVLQPSNQHFKTSIVCVLTIQHQGKACAMSEDLTGYMLIVAQLSRCVQFLSYLSRPHISYLRSNPRAPASRVLVLELLELDQPRLISSHLSPSQIQNPKSSHTRSLIRLSSPAVSLRDKTNAQTGK